MTIPPLILTLDRPTGSPVGCTFPHGVFRVDGPETRYFSRLGDLGVRFYTREAKPGEFVCELWPANPFAGSGVIDWTKLAMTAPIGWTMAAYPRLGLTIGPGMWTLGDGSVQCFPTRRGLAPIRFVLAAPGKHADLGLLDAGSIPEVVTSFGPLGMAQPKVDRTAYLGPAKFDLDSIRIALAQGTVYSPSMPGLDYECGIVDQALGVWQPLGPRAEAGNPGGGNPAGADIRTLPGYPQVLPDALRERQRMDQALERQLHAWDPVTGDALTQEQLPGIQYSASRGAGTSDGELPGFRTPGDVSACPYARTLELIGPYDWAHYVRALNPAMVAWEYLKDPVAADFIVDMAEEARLSFSDNGPTAETPNEWQPRNLANYLAVAKRNPHHGGDCGRYRGWPAWSVAMAHKVRPRREYKHWAKKFCDWADTCQMPNGLWQWSSGDEQFHCPPGVAASQSFEVVYFAHARAACGIVAGFGTDALPVLKAIDALYVSRTLARQPYVWNTASYGPPHFVAVGNANTGEPYAHVSFGWHADGGPNTGDPTNAEAGIALAWMVSGNADKYRRALLQYGFPHATLAEKVATFGLDLNWYAGAMALAQKWLEGHP